MGNKKRKVLTFNMKKKMIMMMMIIIIIIIITIIKEKKFLPGPGFEPRSPAQRTGALTNRAIQTIH